MHGTPLSWTQGRSHSRRRRLLRPRALKDRFAWFRPPRHRTWSCCRRSFVYRARSGLRHNHARRSARWRPGRRCCLHFGGRNRWRRRRGHDCRRRDCRGRTRRNSDGGRRACDWRNDRGRNRRLGRNDHRCRRARGGDRSGCNELWRRRFDDRLGRNSGLGRRHNWRFGLRDHRRNRGHGLDHGTRRSLGSRFLLLDGPQHVSRAGNVREVNLGLNLAFRACSPRGPGRGRLFRVSAEMVAHQNRLVLFERTGVRLLLGDPDFGEHVENRLAFHFQLACQIVDSNLTHPPSRFF